MTVGPASPALVTGAAGFFGSHLVARLARDGCAVSGIDIAPDQRAQPDGVRVVAADVRDSDALRRVIADLRPAVVYHLAAQASVTVSMRDPAHDIDVNVLGSVRVAQAAIEGGVQRLVFVSTGGALYGEPDQVPVTEAATPAPLSVYGVSKLAAERYLTVLAADAQIDLSIVRPANIYGPGQDPLGEAGVVAIFAAKMLRDEPVTIFGDGSQQRDYLYVDDAVDATVLAAVSEPAACLIGTATGTSTLDVYQLVARFAGYEREPKYEAERPGDIQRIALASERAKRLWGWEASTSLEDGFAATVDWFRANPRNE
ncbi:MAG TPA: NAD-dependent epimerase/dehydratase family protein [Dehalococcoidia bacterium]|jgi:nucleoside-diphosphate-sugar epimerase|nr:NAD-dependent epimerase/dehydratase family protein [Dehalococcoidia bacterium]